MWVNQITSSKHRKTLYVIYLITKMLTGIMDGGYLSQYLSEEQIILQMKVIPWYSLQDLRW